jgi:hypothetical protein
MCDIHGWTKPGEEAVTVTLAPTTLTPARFCSQPCETRRSEAASRLVSEARTMTAPPRAPFPTRVPTDGLTRHRRAAPRQCATRSATWIHSGSVSYPRWLKLSARQRSASVDCNSTRARAHNGFHDWQCCDLPAVTQQGHECTSASTRTATTIRGWRWWSRGTCPRWVLWNPSLIYDSNRNTFFYMLPWTRTATLLVLWYQWWKSKTSRCEI